MKMSFVYPYLIFFLGVSLWGCAQGTPKTPQTGTIDEAIRHLMAVNGSAETAKVGIRNMISMMKTNPSTSSLPPDFWSEAEKDFTGPALDELLAGYVPIYKKHFSAEEIAQLTAFYESPIGKKFVAESPGITQESMKMGSEWGQALGEKVARKIAERQKNK